MTTAYLHWLCAYNQWANARYFEAMSQLSEAQLTRPLISSFPSLLDTANHIVVAEWGWLERWRGISPTEDPSWYEQPNLVELRAVLSEVERERFEFLAELRDEQVGERIAYRLLGGRAASGQLGVLVQHVVNHSTFHRGQLATMLRQLGATPPGSDLDDFPTPAPF